MRQFNWLLIVLLYTFCSFNIVNGQIWCELKDAEVTVFLDSTSVFSIPRSYPMSAYRNTVKTSFRSGIIEVSQRVETAWEYSRLLDTFSTENSVVIRGEVRNYQGTFRFYIHLSQSSNKTINIQFIDSIPANKRTLRFSKTKREPWFGGGEQYSTIQVNGHEIPLLVEEQGVGRGDQPISRIVSVAGAQGSQYTTYAPIPFFLSQTRAVWSNLSGYQIANFRYPNLIEWSFWDEKPNLEWAVAQSPLELIQTYTNTTGRMRPLPFWAYGSILGIQGGWKKVLPVLKQSLAAENPVEAIWIQDWVGSRKTQLGTRLWWNWLPDEARYPNFKSVCDSLLGAGIHVLGYINPFFAPEGSIGKEVITRGFAIQTPSNEPFKLSVGGSKAVLLDIWNPKAKVWFKELIAKNLIGNGLSGWMADFGEWLPPGSRSYKRICTLSDHNDYADLWIELMAEIAAEHPDLLIFNRSGFRNSVKNSQLFWAGDQTTSFQTNDGLMAQFRGILSGGFSGISQNHGDIGGYTNLHLPLLPEYRRDCNMLEVWMAFCAFLPVFRTHEGLIPERNCQFYTHDSLQRQLARWARFHRKLIPYWLACGNEATELGYPIIRHSFLVASDAPEALQAQKQFFVGNDLLVVPQLTETPKSVSCWLPPGEWISLLTGEIFQGGKFAVTPKPIVAFVRVNSPFQDLILEAAHEIWQPKNGL
ncbi:MAG: alpha-glucosidase [Bacteroidia bacterium]|nr:alpha-glucosidase [Bacteroidia bacterium]